MRVVFVVLLLGLSVAAEPGQELFQRHCQTCHGPQGLGDGPAAAVMPQPPRNLTLRPYRFGCGPGAVARTIRTGIAESGRPAFAETLSEQEIDTLAQYVRSLQKGCRHP